MQPVELKSGIYLLGSVDFNLQNFHNYSRSPLGSTYNAYLALDEKNVLFDTVSLNHCGELIKHLGEIIDPQKIDYIVCNHLEKDHAGALPHIVALCKPEKIFCSALGQKSMMAQFKTDGWPIQVVKDGERLNIGKRNITFLEARMIHWPDSMFSYFEEDKMLISNDAFGQNIASSGRFADEYDRSQLLMAMKEYYANIVLPFSPLVLKALDRIASLGLEIDMIAPDHGLIFRKPEDVQFVLDSYRSFAEQKPRLGAVIAYATMWSGTEKMAYAVGDGLADEGVPYTLINMQENHVSVVMTALADASCLILGSATRNNMPLVNMVALMANVKGLRPQNLVGGSFGCYGWSGEAPGMLADGLVEIKAEVVGEPVKALFSPDEKSFTQCRELGRQAARALKAKVAAS